MHLQLTRTRSDSARNARQSPKPTIPTRHKSGRRVSSGRETKGERILSAAIRLADASVFGGVHHFAAEAKARRALAGKSMSQKEELLARKREGYVTTTGRFVNFERAYDIAVKGGQITRKSYHEAYQDLWGPKEKFYPGLEALAFENARTS